MENLLSFHWDGSAKPRHENSTVFKNKDDLKLTMWKNGSCPGSAFVDRITDVFLV